MINSFILKYYGVNEYEIRRALDSVFPVIQCLGQGYHSYKSYISNFLTIVMIFSTTKVSLSWKEIFIKGLTHGKFAFIAGSKIMQAENSFKFRDFLEGPRSLYHIL